jgi:hypothetical protein
MFGKTTKHTEIQETEESLIAKLNNYCKYHPHKSYELFFDENCPNDYTENHKSANWVVAITNCLTGRTCAVWCGNGSKMDTLKRALIDIKIE